MQCMYGLSQRSGRRKAATFFSEEMTGPEFYRFICERPVTPCLLVRARRRFASHWTSRRNPLQACISR